MTILKLAWRNLIGAGIRTWLNGLVLSLAFVVIIWHKGMLEGWHQQAKHDTIAWEIGSGQYWHEEYDPFDPFTITDSHGPIPESLQGTPSVPILVTQASIYPDGRLQNILLKGVPKDQKTLALPTSSFTEEDDAIPAIIGTRMAKNNNLKKGDMVTVRWRDTFGTFDAGDILIVDIYKTDVPTVDNGQIWVPLARLQNMLQMQGNATLIVTDDNFANPPSCEGWIYQTNSELLQDLDAIIKSKSIGGMFLYGILLALGMLALFDTQVVAIFRRRKEIGTSIALGMTRRQVVWLFTLEGTLHSFFAIILALIYGLPFFIWQATKGMPIPATSDDYGMAISERIYPVYGLSLVLGTMLFMIVATTLVSYIPARKIARMNPTDAIRGRSS